MLSSVLVSMGFSLVVFVGCYYSKFVHLIIVMGLLQPVAISIGGPLIC